MPGTERLYYSDSHLIEFEARVIDKTDRVSGWAAVTLDRTAFYPTGGGQPSDTGTLDGSQVLECIDDEENGVLHVIQGRAPQVGDIVKGRIDGRSTEIQRLIGRSLRAVVDLEKLGPRTMWVDCDVLQADGGTRTAAITGASLAVAVACRKLAREKKVDAPPLRKLVAAVSAGVLDGNPIVDLNYEEDKAVTVDFNLVATEDGDFVEVQGSGEEATFAQSQLEQMLVLSRKGIADLIAAQRAVLARLMVTPPAN